MGAPDTEESCEVLVVGAGFAGLYLVHKLRQSGFDVVAVERAPDVGGTWYWNRYPGARCDQESVYYSYSFDEKLQQDWEWTERYATQPEILRYLNHVADRFGLRSSILFDTEVVGATWEPSLERWTVALNTGRTVSARYLVMATGCLSTPLVPDLPGLDRFEGRVLYTSMWPHDEVDVTGRRVAVIGTGSSGVQVIPVLAQKAAQLVVLQRTASFVLPAGNAPLDPTTVATIKARYSELRQRSRTSSFGSPAVNVPTQSALAVDPSERADTYARAYDFGHLGALIQTYNDLLTDLEANETAAEYIRSRIRQIVDDPVTADRLLPTGFPLGTKRPCLGTDYYETYNRENVTLVSVRATPELSISAHELHTTGVSFPLDDIVIATGFDAITGSLLRIPLRGRDGRLLANKWRDGPKTYLGVAVSGFPNLFTVTGPGSPSVLSNVVVSIEQHVDFIVELLEHAASRSQATVEARESDEEEWMAQVAEAAAGTLFPRAASWYVGANVPGKPRVFMPYVGGVGTFREICDNVSADGYQGFKFVARHAAVS